MLAQSVVEYVIVHELVYLRIKNDSQDFWQLLASVLPDVGHRRRLLREAGKTLAL